MRAAPHRPTRPIGPTRNIPAALVAVLAGLLLLASCTGPPGEARPGSSEAAPPPGALDPKRPDLGTDGLTALTTRVLQDYWRSAFPAAFGRPWRDVGTFSPVHPDRQQAPPPCATRAADLRGNAFYCPAADAVVWDADELIPQLRARFGPPGIVVVLAHEMGHAAQTRLGVDELQRNDPARYPTILLEAMSDCYAGAAIRHLVDTTTIGVSPLPLGPAERDLALQALVTFRDPLGTLAADASAHGNAFDRLSAVEDGYTAGPGACAGMSLQDRQFTQRRFGSVADRARGGNLPLDRLLAAMTTDARGWYDDVVAPRAPSWRAPQLGTDTRVGACAGTGRDAQGAVRFCAADGSVVADLTALAALQRRFGDFAGATLVASRYGLAALAAAGTPTTGSAAGRAATCLAGAYTARLVDPAGAFGLSPGDLDEAVQLLLAEDWTGRDAAGAADPADHGFERVATYRRGFTGGPAACGL